MKKKLIRIFVACPPTTELLDLYSSYISLFQDISGVRWTKSNNLHLTLFFIGEIEEENLNSVIEEVKFIRESFDPFVLEFEKITYRGKAHKPGMIWAQYQKHDSFTELSALIHRSVSKYMTIIPTHLDPIPHITLARLKKGAELNPVRSNEIIFPDRFTVDVMEVWKTVTNDEGVIYDRVG